MLDGFIACKTESAQLLYGIVMTAINLSLTSAKTQLDAFRKDFVSC